MRGRTPKEPEARQRRNKASTAAILEREDGTKLKVPALTREILGAAVLPSTRRWWTAIWRSPMAGRWLDSDIEGLYIVAILRNEFFNKPTAQVAGEIRQQEARFGLTPIDRRRLDWTMAPPRPRDIAPTGESKAPRIPEPITNDEDPRRRLRAVP